MLARQRESRTDLLDSLCQTVQRDLTTEADAFGLSRCFDYLLFPLFALLRAAHAPYLLDQTQKALALRTIELSLLKCGARYWQTTSAPSHGEKEGEEESKTETMDNGRLAVELMLFCGQLLESSETQEELRQQALLCIRAVVVSGGLFPALSFRSPSSSTAEFVSQEREGRENVKDKAGGAAIVAWMFWLVLEETKKSQRRELQRTAITTIQALISAFGSQPNSTSSNTDTEEAKEKEKEKEVHIRDRVNDNDPLMVLDRLAFVFPGLVSTLAGKVFLGDYKQGQSVRAAALGTCVDAVCMLLDDLLYFHQDSSSTLPSSASVEELRKYAASTRANNMQEERARENGEDKIRQTKTSEEQPFVAVRDQRWLQLTSLRLQLLFARIFSVSKEMVSYRQEIKRCLAGSALRLLCSCHRTLNAAVPMFLETLLYLSNDELAEVREEASLALSVLLSALCSPSFSPLLFLKGLLHSCSLSVFVQKYASLHKDECLDQLKSHTLKLLSGLPRQIRDPDEATKVVSLRLVLNHVKALAEHCPSFLKSPTFLAPLSFALFQALEFDEYDVRSSVHTPTFSLLLPSPLPLSSSSSLSSSSHSSSTTNNQQTTFCFSYPRKVFRNFRTEQPEKTAVDICAVLGSHGEPRHALDFFLGVLQDITNARPASASASASASVSASTSASVSASTSASSSRHQYLNQCIFVLNHIISGISSNINQHPDRKDEGAEENVRYVLDGYLSHPLWDMPEQHHHQQQQADLLLSQSLLLEGIGNCAEALGPSFHPYLQKVLHPLFEHLGGTSSSGAHSLSRSAHATLLRICVACSYASISRLIAANSDYLIDSLCSRLKHLRMYPRAPQVLHAVLRYCHYEEKEEQQKEEEHDELLLPLLLDDTIEGLFNGLDDSENDVDIVVTLLGILNGVLGALRRLPPAQQEDDEEEEDHQEWEEATDEGDERTQQEPITEGEIKNKEESEEKMNAEHIEVEEEDEDAIKRKQQVQMVMRILDRARHFAPSRSREVRLLVLSILQRGIILLSTDRRTLLPAVHEIWLPLTHRLHDYDDEANEEKKKKRITFRDEKQMKKKEDPAVKIKVLEVVATICEQAGDFVFHKFKEDVWPVLVQHLLPEQQRALAKELSMYSFAKQNESRFSSSASSSSASYVYMTSFKLQDVALECVEAMVRHSLRDYSSAQFKTEVVRACLAYISLPSSESTMAMTKKKTVKELEGRAISIMKRVLELNPPEEVVEMVAPLAASYPVLAVTNKMKVEGNGMDLPGHV
ncbi:TEL2-interacting protein 1 [Balamuthia mandrillaris]